LAEQNGGEMKLHVNVPSTQKLPGLEGGKVQLFLDLEAAWFFPSDTGGETANDSRNEGSP
jgi:hypothetical protein